MSRTMKNITRILAVILTVLFVFQIMPNETLAADVQENAKITEAVQSANEKDEALSQIVSEVKSKRDEYTKVYKKVDGSYTAVVSASPIHYKENGKWKDIDNSLLEKAVNGETVLENKSNDFTVNLPDEMSSGKEVLIEKDGYNLSFELQTEELKNSNNKVRGKVKNNKSKNLEGVSKAVEYTDFESKTSSVIYNSIKENVDLEYVVTSTGLKENIVLQKKPKSEVSYTYEITAPNLSGTKNEDGSVSFKADNGKTVFSIPAPVMYDVKMTESMDIDVGFSGENGIYLLTYTPSYEWLKKSAKYPVVIDPVIETPKTASGLVDTYVDSTEPSTNFGSSTILGVAKNSSQTVMSLLNTSDNFVLSSGVVIKSVKLYVSVLLTTLSANQSVDILAYPITGEWTETGVKYNNLPAISSDYEDKIKITGNPENTEYSFDVTGAYIGGSKPNGIMLKQDTDSTGGTACVFYSSDNISANAKQPYFEIEYYETSGVHNMYDYHTKSLGRAGNVYINDFTNQVYIEREELGLSGNKMPVQIKRHYNSSIGTLSETNLIYGVEINPYGFGWNLNYTQFIEYNPNFSGGESRILYYNESGQTVYFEKTETVSNGKREWIESTYEHISDTGCKLYVPTEYENNIASHLSSITIKDLSDKIYEFNGYGFLTKINSKDNATGSISIVYCTDDELLIDKIIDGVGRQYRFSYTNATDGNKILTSIQAFSSNNIAIKVKNDAGNNVNYKYTYTYADKTFYNTSFSSLATVTYPDNKTVSYSISQNGVLAKNIDGIAMYSGKLSTGDFYMTERAYYSETEFITGNSMTVSNISTYEKTFADETYGEVLTKQFDRFGRTTCVIDSDGTVYPYAYTSEKDEFGEIRNALYNVALPEEADETNLLTNGSFSTNLNGWSISNSTYMVQSNTADYLSENTDKGALVVIGNRNDVRAAEQVISVSDGEKGDQYRLDGWAKTEFTHSDLDSLEVCAIYVESRMNTTGTEEWNTIGLYEFNSLNPNWNILSRQFTVNEDYNEIKVSILYYFQYGGAYFDGLSLVNTYKATSGGGSGSGSSSSGTCTCEYCNGNCNCNHDGLTECTPATCPDCGKCKCDGCIEPNCPCRCENNCTHSCCGRSFDYSSDVNGFSMSLIDGVDTLSMSQTNAGNYPASSTDFNGNTTTYTYNQNTGNLSGVCDGKDTYTAYSHNAMGELTNVQKTVAGLSGDASSMATQYSYNNDRIQSITHNGFSYNYTYDVWGKLRSVKVNDSMLTWYDYENDAVNNGALNKIEYGNGDEIQYTYNSDGNIEYIKNRRLVNNSYTETQYQYIYNGNIVSEIKDLTAGIKTVYNDDGYSIQNELGTVTYYATLTENGERTETYRGTNYTTAPLAIDNSYNIDTGERTSGTSISSTFGTVKTNSTSDWFGRVKTNNFSYELGSEDGIGYGLNSETSYSYKTVDNQTSTLVDKYSSTLYVNTYVKDETLLEEPFEAEQETINSFEYHYQYDANGNITRVFLEETYDDGSVETSTLCRYTYDDADQLIREDNAYLQKSFKYIYDCGGNISSRKEYAFTEDALGTEITNVSYGYDNDSNNNNNATWNDKLINYNGQTISYDSIGNPLNIVSKNQSGDTENMTAEWNGRQLSSLVCSGEKYVYEYNSDGLRTATKIYNNSDGTFQSSYRYLWDGDKYLGYIICSEDGTVTLSAKLIYDGNGNAIGYIYENENNVQTPFYYGKNLQGDITAVYDSGGALLVTYNYDAWGNVTPTANGSSFQQALLAIVAVVTNPIAYRGYQFDVRTGLYYLQSRYYNPSYGRFINTDTVGVLDTTKGTLLGANLFAYCNNNPVMKTDPTGRMCFGIGVAFTGGAIYGWYVSLQMVFDLHGNYGLLLTAGFGAQLLYNITFSKVYTILFKDNITAFEEWSFTGGGSFTVPLVPPIVSVGLDIVLSSSLKFLGLSFGIGVSAGPKFEFHTYACFSVFLAQGKIDLSFFKAYINEVKDFFKLYI